MFHRYANLDDRTAIVVLLRGKTPNIHHCRRARYLLVETFLAQCLKVPRETHRGPGLRQVEARIQSVVHEGESMQVMIGVGGYWLLSG